MDCYFNGRYNLSNGNCQEQIGGAGEETLYEIRTISGDRDPASTFVGRRFLDVPRGEWFDPCAAGAGRFVVYFPLYYRPPRSLVLATREAESS